jgi:hypothetical protein
MYRDEDLMRVITNEIVDYNIIILPIDDERLIL